MIAKLSLRSFDRSGVWSTQTRDFAFTDYDGNYRRRWRPKIKPEPANACSSPFARTLPVSGFFPQIPFRNVTHAGPSTSAPLAQSPALRL
jgi:hypothetical protein